MRTPVSFNGTYYIRAMINGRWGNKAIPVAQVEDGASIIEFIPAWMGEDPDVLRFVEGFNEYWQWRDRDGEQGHDAGWYGPIQVAIPV